MIYLGWGCAEDRPEGEGEKVFRALDAGIVDREGRPVESSCVRLYRADVLPELNGIRRDEDYGFCVSFTDTGDKSYTLRLADPETGITRDCPIHRRELEILEREEGRRFDDFRDMLRHYSPSMFRDDFWYLRHCGLMSLARLVRGRCGRSAGPEYQVWRKKRLVPEREKAEQRKTVFDYAPKISIVVPAFKTPESFLREMIDSVKAQTYGNWQLCVADGSADDADTHVSAILRDYAAADPRIVFCTLEDNLGIAGNTNAALALADGEYIALLDHDDVLEDTALYEVVSLLQEQPYKALYTDEDKVSTDLRDYYEPHFKPDFSPDLLRSNNYICHLFVVKKEIADRVGGFREAFDGSQDYDFILRCTERASSVGHVRKALYHWRCHAGSTAANQASKMYCYEAGQRAIEEHLRRVKLSGEVTMMQQLGFYRVRYDLAGEPLISILIPNKDQKDILKRCIDSILQKTTYREYEILIIENNSTGDEIFAYYEELKKDPRIRVLTWDGPFNYSAINNFGASQAKGEYLLLLNNDTEVIADNWLEEMLGDCQRPEVGAVGAKLLYPDGTVQHAGVVIGLGGVAGHVFTRIDAQDAGYFGRAIIRQNYSAVTAACLMVSAEDFASVGGLDETLAVAFNDIDFCLKLCEKGRRNVWNPAAELYHHESISRGAEDTAEKQKRFWKEIAQMNERWAAYYEGGDPYYNPNLSLILQDGPFALSGQGRKINMYKKMIKFLKRFR